MSKFLTPPIYNNRGLENQLKNTIFNAHDLACGCKNPLKHLQHLFSEKCHHTEGTTDGIIHTDTNEEDGFDEGDLQRIFEENFTENDDR